MKNTYLATGTSGFIGSMLLRRLVNNGEKVHIILRKNSNTLRIKDLLKKTTVHYSDLSDVSDLKKILKKSKPNIIYHLATNGAYSSQDNADLIIRTNILGTWNLLQAAEIIDYDLFVNTGSSSEYGFKKQAMRETDILEPMSYYAVAKSTQTLLASLIAHLKKRPIVTLRPFSVYGPYESPQRFIPTLMNALITNGKMNLVSPNIARDYIYVEDMIDAYLKIDALKKNVGEYFNIGTGIQSTIKEVVNTAVAVTNKKAKFHWKKMKDRTWDTDTWVADISKAKMKLGWRPKVNLNEGLKLTFDWFLKNNI